MNFKTRLPSILLTLLMIPSTTVWISCGGLKKSSSEKAGIIFENEIPTPSESDVAASTALGRLSVTMHDFPIKDKNVSQVFVTIREVQVGSDTQGWTVVNDQTQEYDLLTLVDNVAVTLGKASLSPGTYDQIRLILGENNRVIADGEVSTLKVPSGQQTGIKLDGPFTIGGGEIVNIELDFNAEKSVHWNQGQGYMLKPVIQIVSVTSAGGLVGAREISATEGGVVALPDGAMIQIPAGALSENTEVVFEKVPDTQGGSQVTPVYHLAPEGLQLSVPALVRLPYDPALLPAGTSEEDLVVTHNFERLKESIVDTAENVLAATVTHFSPIAGEAPKVTPKTIAPGVLHYDYGNNKSPPYHIIVVDLSHPGVGLKVLLAPEKDFEPDTYLLQSVSDQVKDAKGKLLLGEGLPVAINGWNWIGSEGAPFLCSGEDCTGKLTSTTYVDGIEKAFFSEGEMKLAFASNNDIEIEERTTRAALPYNWGVLGSSTTVMWNGEWRNKSGSYSLDTLDAAFKSYVPRTAVGLNKTKTKLFMVVVGGDGGTECCQGANFQGVFNIFKGFGADRAILLDGGPSSTLIINGESQDILRGAVYGAIDLAGGRKVVNSLAVHTLPLLSPPGPSTINVEDRRPSEVAIGSCGPTDEFCLFGPVDYWHSREGLGSGSHMWYTSNNDGVISGVENSARWTPTLPLDKTYRVEAFIPSNCATTTCARYQIVHAGGTTCKIVNQLNLSTDVNGIYADLGTYSFKEGRTGSVELEDLTYEPWLSATRPAREVGVDLIRWVPVTNPADPAPAVDYCDESTFQDACDASITSILPCPL